MLDGWDRNVCGVTEFSVETFLNPEELGIWKRGRIVSGRASGERADGSMFLFDVLL